MNDQDANLVKAEQSMVALISPLQKQSNSLLVMASAQQVTDEQSLSSAVVVKKQITAHRTLVQGARLDITRRIDTLKKAIMDKEAEVLGPLDEAQNIISARIITYQDEQERIKQAEIKRIGDIIDSLYISNPYAFKTVTEVNTQGQQLKAIFASLPTDDASHPQIKLAFTESINKLTDRKTYLEEQVKQEAEREILDAKEAELAAKQRRLAAKEEKLKREDQRIADEQELAKALARQAKDDRNAVKTGVRTVVEFTITNADLVPRELCEPSMVLIRAAYNANKLAIPGVKVTVNKKV